VNEAMSHWNQDPKKHQFHDGNHFSFWSLLLLI